MQQRNVVQQMIFLSKLLLVLLVSVGYFATVALAQDDEDEAEEPVATVEASDIDSDAAPPIPADEDHSGQSCGECHLDYHDAWLTGVHAIAYERESFQEAWAAEENNPECLSCHTTDFRPATGEYAAENITCQACHGTTPPDHPPAVYVVGTDASICGDCHVATFDEWEHSLHAFTPDMGAVGCATCHEPHSQQIRFETVDTLCLNCHKDDEHLNTYVHLTHNEVDFEDVSVTCSSCHMFNQQADEVHQLADHTMSVETIPCTDCHETIAEMGVSTRIIDIDRAIAEERDELRSQVEELEEQLVAETELAEAQQPINFVQLTQGLIVGLGLGITVVLVLRRNGGNQQS